MHRLFASIIVLAVVLSACGGGGPASPTAAPVEPTAKVAEVQNAVEAREIAGAKWAAAALGQLIRVGGGVKTGEAARARVDLADGSIVRLSANTQFELKQLAAGATTLTLDGGKVWTSASVPVTGTFEIETPVGVAAVRGSLMSGEYLSAAGRFVVTCLDGHCRLTGTSGAFIDLIGGQQSEIPGLGLDPTPPIPMDASQLAEWTREFTEARTIVATLTPQLIRPTDTPLPTLAVLPDFVGQTACDHPYLPMRPGASWSYSGSDGVNYTWSIAGVQGDVNNATAEMINDFGTGQVTYHWQCNANGLVSYEFGSIAGDTTGQIASFEVKNPSGTFLPPADLLEPGYSWTSSYEMDMQFSAAAGGSIATMSWSQSYTVVAIEPVKVKDQTFEGLRISGSGTGVMTINIAGAPAQTIPINNTFTYLLARGVGLVHSESTSPDFTSTSDLTDYTIP